MLPFFVKSKQTEFSSVICGNFYEFSIGGKLICSNAFMLLLRIARETLVSCCDFLDEEMGDSISSTLVEDNPIRPTIKSEIQSFFHFLHESDAHSEPDSVSGERVLSSWKTKKLLYEDFIAWTRCKTSISYFCKIWKENYPQLITRTTIVSCDTCFSLKTQIKSETNEQNQQKLKCALATHRNRQRDLRNLENSLRTQSVLDPRIITINSDHMAKKFLVKFENSTKQLSSVSSALKIHTGGHYVHNANHTYYFFLMSATVKILIVLYPSCTQCYFNLLKVAQNKYILYWTTTAQTKTNT